MGETRVEEESAAVRLLWKTREEWWWPTTKMVGNENGEKMDRARTCFGSDNWKIFTMGWMDKVL